ncbi:hypothetical protein MtrunA17_Chr5g0404611 [Medicago truncatula]|uniref:Uncharacterized protein n=1 Tax=Medicago truncatula TaxID=3880 RepID=A0A396HS69_MEDTR|nr:hypothetical protein MtrunA17_Chr5g0404611 [Medicago truncatula]
MIADLVHLNFLPLVGITMNGCKIDAWDAIVGNEVCPNVVNSRIKFGPLWC